MVTHDFSAPIPAGTLRISVICNDHLHRTDLLMVKNLFAGRTACGRLVWIQRLGCTEGEYPVGIVERRSYGGQP